MSLYSPTGGHRFAGASGFRCPYLANSPDPQALPTAAAALKVAGIKYTHKERLCCYLL
jgi:hypothetical protein